MKKFNLLTRDGRDGRDAVFPTLIHCHMSLFYSFSSWKEREKASHIRVAKSASRASQRNGIKTPAKNNNLFTLQAKNKIQECWNELLSRLQIL